MLVGPFSEGLALAKDESGYFHITLDGLPAYDERFDETRTFSGGYAVARIGMHFIYIDHHGTQLSSMLFAYATPFRDGYANVIKDREQYLIDRRGNLTR